MSEMRFRRSSRCNNGSCLLVAYDRERIVVANSKDPSRTLKFSIEEFTAFLGAIKAGEFDPAASGVHGPGGDAAARVSEPSLADSGADCVRE